jgi:hypothetical protein
MAILFTKMNASVISGRGASAAAAGCEERAGCTGGDEEEEVVVLRRERKTGRASDSAQEQK